MQWLLTSDDNGRCEAVACTLMMDVLVVTHRPCLVMLPSLGMGYAQLA